MNVIIENLINPILSSLTNRIDGGEEHIWYFNATNNIGIISAPFAVVFGIFSLWILFDRDARREFPIIFRVPFVVLLAYLSFAFWELSSLPNDSYCSPSETPQNFASALVNKGKIDEAFAMLEKEHNKNEPHALQLISDVGMNQYKSAFENLYVPKNKTNLKALLEYNGSNPDVYISLAYVFKYGTDYLLKDEQKADELYAKAEMLFAKKAVSKGDLGALFASIDTLDIKDIAKSLEKLETTCSNAKTIYSIQWPKKETASQEFKCGMINGWADSFAKTQCISVYNETH